MRIALLQSIVHFDKQKTLERIAGFLQVAQANGAKLAVLPECFNCPYGREYFDKYAEPIPGPTTDFISKAARENNLWIVAVFNEKGALVAKYRKMHLFDVDIPGKVTFKESDYLTAGNEPTVFEMEDGWKCGLGICFDLRFPELALAYAKAGCNLLIYPSAFTSATGEKYFELLQRARAVDTQSFVVTCAPALNTEHTFLVYGHSTVTRPDGTILSRIDGNQEEMLLADLEMNMVDMERRSIPTCKSKIGKNYLIKEN